MRFLRMILLDYSWLIKLINNTFIITPPNQGKWCEEPALTPMSTNHISKLLHWSNPTSSMFFFFLLYFFLWLSVAALSSLALRLLVDTVMHFPPSLEEVTVSVSDERMWVRNHVEEEGGDYLFHPEILYYKYKKSCYYWRGEIMLKEERGWVWTQWCPCVLERQNSIIALCSCGCY